MNRNRRRGFIALTLGVLALTTAPFVARPSQGAAPIAQVVQDATTLLKQADAQAAAGKYAEAAALYEKAAAAYHTAGKADAEAKAYERAAQMYEKVAAAPAGGGKAPTPPRAAPAPQPRPAAPPPQGTAPVNQVSTPRIPAPAARAGYIVGRAVKEDGSALPKFRVYYSGFEKGKFFLSNSKVGGIPNVSGRVEGQSGQFAIKVPDGVYGSSGSVVVNYHGGAYQFELWREPRKYDFPDTGLQYLRNGLVHNYVWRLSGKKDTGIDNYYGCTINADCDAGIKGLGDKMLWEAEPKGSKVEVTLVPQGPLVDGSTGKTLVRTFDLSLTGKIYDVPMGAYTVSARVIEPNGTAKPLKISSNHAQYDTATRTSRMDWRDSISILFPPSHTWGVDSTIPGGADPVDIFLGQQDARAVAK